MKKNSPIVQVEFTSERVLKYANNLLAGDDTNEAFEKVFMREPTAKDIVALEMHPEYHNTVDAVRHSVVQTALTNAVGFYSEGMKTMWNNFQSNQKILDRLYDTVNNLWEDYESYEDIPKNLIRDIDRFARLNNDIYKEMRNKFVELTEKSLKSDDKDEHEEVWEEFD